MDDQTQQLHNTVNPAIIKCRGVYSQWAKLRLQNGRTSCIIADRKTCRQISAGRVILCIR